MPDMTLTLKGRNGDTLAKTQFTSIYSTLATAAISGVDHTLVAMNTVNSDGEERMLTGYVENSVLAQLDVTNVQLPSNFAGLEGQVIPTRLKEQLFEITNVVEGDDYVEITAQHIFYRLRQNTTLWEANESLSYSGAAVCRNVVTNAMFDAQVYVASDCTDTMSGKDLDYARLNIVEAFLNPESGICKKFGLSIIRDNDVFYCLKNVGYDRGFVVQDGKNLLGVERTVNIENTVTRLAPVARDEDGNIVWLSYNGLKYVDSPHVTDYSRPKLGIFDTGLRIGKDGVTTDNVQAKLLEAAQKQFTENQVDLPAVTMTIQFLSLGDTEEYSQYRNLDKVYLYDILSIKDSVRGYSYQAEVVGVEHDILTGRLNAVTIGTLQDWDGIRKVATWQVPEVNGEKIRLKSIQAGAFQANVIGASEIRSGAVQSQHFSQSADGHFKTIFAEQLYISNTSPDGLLNTRFSVSEGNITALVEKTGIDYLPAGTSIYGELEVEAGKVAMVVGTSQGQNYIKAAEIAVSINDAGQGVALINADHVNISSTSSSHLLSGSIVYDSNGNLVLKESSGGGIVIERESGGTTAQFGVFDEGTLTAGVIATTVNGTPSVYITADNIKMSSASGANNLQVEVNGKLNANAITATYINSLYSGTSAFNSNLGTIGFLTSTFHATDSMSLDGSSPFSNCIIDASVNSTTNVLTLIRANGEPVTFSKATSTTKVSGSWSGGTYTVSADSSGHALPISESITVYAIPRSGQLSDEFTVYAATPLGGSNYDNHVSKNGQLSLSGSGSSAKIVATLGGTTVAQYGVSEIYEDAYDAGESAGYSSGYSTGNSDGQSTGWVNAYNQVSLPGSGTGASMTVKTPAATRYTVPTQVSTTYTVTADNTYAYIKVGSTTVARNSHNAYSNGQTAAGLELDTTNHKVKRSLSSSSKEYTVTVDTTSAWSGGSKTVYAKLAGIQMASSTITLPTISGFGTTSPGGYSITSGAGLSANVRINTTGTWTQGGKSFSGTSYLSITPTQLYRDAYAAVTIPTNTCAAGTSESATITATASNGATKGCTVTAAYSGFAGGGTYAQVKIGSTVIARTWASLPSSASWSSYWPASNVISVTCNVGGKSYTQSFTR